MPKVQPQSAQGLLGTMFEPHDLPFSTKLPVGLRVVFLCRCRTMARSSATTVAISRRVVVLVLFMCCVPAFVP
jgi:hypothetical protein